MSSDSPYRVETTCRLAQWRIENLASCTYRKSHPFKIGLWNWHLSVEKNRTLFIRLFPEISNLTRENPPVASFVIRVISSSAGDRKCFVHPDVIDKQLKTNEDFVWAIDVPLTGRFIIEVEFLDLKQGPDPITIWGEIPTREGSTRTALTSLGRMLSEGIHTDIVINTSDGPIGAHRAVLASRSPVFTSMFAHDLREKELSAVDITDMSPDSCRAFLRYIYGNGVGDAEFLENRVELLRAADKYDVADLREACHESLLEDVGAGNVLERLQCADAHGLGELKRRCMRYLVGFGKICDVREELDAFVRGGDRELIWEVFNEVLGAWKGF